MFDAYAVFSTLSGQSFTYSELRERIRQIWAENQEDVPAEFGPRQLFEVAGRNGWIVDEGDGWLKVEVSRRRAA